MRPGALELDKPRTQMAGGLVHFLRCGSFSERRRIQQRVVCSRGTGSKQTVQTAGSGDGQKDRDFASVSFGDLGAEVSSLHAAGASLVFGKDGAGGRTDFEQPPGLSYVVRWAEVEKSSKLQAQSSREAPSASHQRRRSR